MPLLVNEDQSLAVNALLARDKAIVVWWATRSECTHAMARKAREGVLTPVGLARARVVLYRLIPAWLEMQPTYRLRSLAEDLLYRYPLKTADAMQLAAALRWRTGRSQCAEFVCFDGQLRVAAEAEGFTIVPT